MTLAISATCTAHRRVGIAPLHHAPRQVARRKTPWTCHFGPIESVILGLVCNHHLWRATFPDRSVTALADLDIRHIHSNPMLGPGGIRSAHRPGHPCPCRGRPETVPNGWVRLDEGLARRVILVRHLSPLVDAQGANPRAAPAAPPDERAQRTLRNLVVRGRNLPVAFEFAHQMVSVAPCEFDPLLVPGRRGEEIESVRRKLTERAVGVRLGLVGRRGTVLEEGPAEAAIVLGPAGGFG